MADVFLSHSSSDRDAAAELEHGLEDTGLSVWWDHELVSGQRFQETIMAELNRASAVVVVWSPTSVKSAWVYSEARRAIDQGKLVQVRTRDLDAEDLPAPFDAFHCSDIDDIGAVVKAARALVGSAGGAPAAGEVEAPPQRSERRALARRPAWMDRRMAVAGLGAAVAAIVVAVILVATGGDDEGADGDVADPCLRAADDTEPYGGPAVDGVEALDKKYAIASPIESGSRTLRLIDTEKNTPEPAPLATDAARPTVSPDRRLLLYLRTCADGRAPWIRAVDGSLDHPFIEPGQKPPDCLDFGRPAWNAEGSEVALTCNGVKDAPVHNIFIFGSDGSLLDSINVEPRPSGGLTWVGDDALVFAARAERERETLWILSPVQSGTKPASLVPGDGRVLVQPSGLVGRGGRTPSAAPQRNACRKNPRRPGK